MLICRGAGREGRVDERGNRRRVVCQAGQVQMCVGGEWQGNGTFCDGTADGRPLGVPVLGPGQIDSAGVRAQGAPIQNAPIDDD